MIRKLFSVTILLLSMVVAKDLNLKEYVQQVITESYERYELGLQSDEIEAQKRQFIADYLPSLSYSLNSSQSKQGPREVFVGSVPISQPATDYEYHSTTLNLSKQIFDWGNSFRKKKSLDLKENSIKADYLQRARLMVEQVLPFFFQLSEAIEIYEILKQELSDAQKQKNHLNELVGRGVKPPIDQLYMNVTMNEILSRLSTQKMTIMQLQAEISFLMDEPIDTTLTPVSFFASHNEMDLNTSADSTDRQIDYLTTQIQLSEMELSILKWNRLPDLYFSAGYSRGNSLFESLYTDFDKDWNIYFSLNLSFPLFQNNNRHLKETQKWIQIQRFKRQLNDERKKTVRQRTLLQKQLQTDRHQIKLKEESIKQFESLYEHELGRYNSGLIEFQLLKEARNNLLKNRQSLISLKHRLMENYEKLKLLLGEWDNVINSTKPN